jgi:hypothetical protein
MAFAENIRKGKGFRTELQQRPTVFSPPVISSFDFLCSMVTLHFDAFCALRFIINVSLSQLFDTVKRNMEDSVEHKVFFIQGDITETGLGISAQNKEELCRDVSIVFHVAATVRFNENLKVALKTNVVGTQEVVNLCKEMPLLAVSQFKHIW